MIDLDEKRYCICPRVGTDNTPKECQNQYTITEKNKSITLQPKHGEKSIAIVIDKCVITDNKTKCDALFLYKKNNKKYSFLIELKGGGNIEQAFKQLSYTQNERKEYRDIINKFCRNSKEKIDERLVIVSNKMPDKSKLTKLRESYKVKRLITIVHKEGSKTPDLRDNISNSHA